MSVPGKGVVVRTKTKREAVALRATLEGEKAAAVAALNRLPVPAYERQRLNDRVVATLPIPEKNARIYRDVPNRRGNDHVPGFAVRVTATGSRSFVLCFGADGKHTIGAFPLMTTEQARAEAFRLRAAYVNEGVNPSTAKAEEKGEMTVSGLWSLWCDKHVQFRRPATQENYKQQYDKYVGPAFGRRQLSTIKRAEVRDWFQAIKAPVQANRTAQLLCAMFNFAVDRELVEVNPASKIKHNFEELRTRYFDDDELKRLVPVIDTWKDQKVASVIRLLWWTGSRVGETLEAKWAHINWRAKTWTKPRATIKQGEKSNAHVVELNDLALELLQHLHKAKDRDDVYIFHGVSYTMCDDHLKRMKVKAGIFDADHPDGPATLHSFRHTFASWTISQGYTLPDVGALLGQKKAQTTARYAHLLPSRKRDASQAAANAFKALLADC